MLIHSNAEPLKTVAAAARETGLSYSTLRRLVQLRRIPSVRIAGRLKVKLSDVQAAIETVPAV